MITIHHLNFSRSTRIIWLMEELGEPYEIVPHTRNPNTFRSPQTLDRIHPLGKAPVIEDGALVIAESGAIIEGASSRPFLSRIFRTFRVRGGLDERLQAAAAVSATALLFITVAIDCRTFAFSSPPSTSPINASRSND
jgi:hypothetical protein